jgi:hypothetical protein
VLPKSRWKKFFSRLSGVMGRWWFERGRPRCPDCASPLQLRDDNKYVYCSWERCDFAGIEAGEVVADFGQPKPGLPRPLIKNRPVPWITPVIGGRAAWIGLNAHRRRQGEKNWLCQHCGERLDSEPTAWVATLRGDIAAGGALHTGCMDEARKACPHLRKDHDYVYVEVHRTEQRHDWSAVFEVLVAYEDQHGELPGILPVTARVAA